MITGVSTAGKLIGVAAGAAAWAGRGMEIMGNLRALLNTWQRAAARLICRARVFLFVAIALLAQPLHLADAFARARESSPELAASRESVRAAQAAADAAGALSNPTVAATLGPDVPELTATVDVKLPIFQRGFAVAAAERDVEAAQALDELLQRAAQHPEIESFRHQQDAALARATRERAALLPLPDLSLAFEQLHGASPALGISGSPAIGLRLGIAFDLPLLSWNSGKVHEAQAQAQVAAAQVRGALAKHNADLRSAHARWNAAAARAKSFAAEIVPAAIDLVRMAREAWELGRTPLTAVRQARTELTSARADASDAALSAQQALADMEEAAGEAL